jgi:Bacterial Ig-like domain/Protein of unknown function (DUF1565)
MTHSRARSRSALVVALLIAALTATSGLAGRAHAAGTVFYVSPTGADTNSGTTSGSPFKTIQKALNVATPGTTITLGAGEYHEAAVTKVAGTAAAPITIKGPETGKAASGRYQAVLYSLGGRALSINHSYYTLDGFTVDGQPNIARTAYPASPTLSGIKAFKNSVQDRAVNSKLVYVGADTTVTDIVGTTISNMFLNGSGGECVRFRDRAANSLVVGSVIQWCGMEVSGDDIDKYLYHNGEGVYIGTSPKSTDQPMYANDTSNNVVVRDSTINTYGSECFEVKENAHHNRLENVDCGYNDEPSSFQGSNVELRGDHNTVLSSRLSQSRSWNLKLASDSATYDRGGNTAQGSTFGGAATYAIVNRQTGSGPFCGDTFSGPVSDPGSNGVGTPTASCADTVAPTAPTNLAATANSPTAVGLTWTAATDNVAVTSYTVLRNGTQVGTSTTLAYTDSALTANTAYSYTVVAKDAAGNTSPASNTASVTTPAPPPSTDTTAPTVTARTPAVGATGVAAGTAVTATLSEPVQGVDATTFTLRAAGATAAVAATVGYDAATRVATLTPTAALAAGTTYTATLTGGASAIRDVANNPLATVSWTFTTAAAADRTAPTVTARSPAADATGIAVGTSVKATFSEAVQGLTTSTFTLRAAGATSNVAAAVAYDAASRTATLTPSSALAANTRYTATLTNGVKDVAGNPLAATTWTFTTAAAADRTAPTVTSRSPGSGATGVNRNGNVTVTFSEAVTGVGSTTFTIRKSSGGSAVTAAVKRDGTTNRWILDPGSTLSSSTTYTVTVTGGTSGIKDVAGNPFGTTTWTFRTGTST